MKLAVENIKNNYLILTIKLLILLLFVLSITIGINRMLEYCHFFSNYESNEFSDSKIISFFIPTLILLIPLTGIFFNKTIGWILIQSYFYFLISNLAFSVKFIDLNDKVLILINVIGFLLLLLILLLMNKKKISSLNYDIEKKELISKNMIASIIGMSITITLAIIK